MSEKKEKKVVVKTVKKVINSYNDGTVVCEEKVLVGDKVSSSSKTVKQNKLTRKKQDERAIVSQEKSVKHEYSDNTSLENIRVFNFKNGEKELVKDLVVTVK